VGAGRARRLAALLTVAFFVLTGCAGVAGPDAPDVFADGLDPGVGARPDQWMAWSLVDRADGRRAGSPNAAMERTNAESSIKAWITTAYLRDAQEDGRDASAEDLALIDRAIRASDDAAAEKLYRKLGADRVLAELEPACGVRVRTSERHYWSYAQISATPRASSAASSSRLRGTRTATGWSTPCTTSIRTARSGSRRHSDRTSTWRSRTAGPGTRAPAPGT